MTNPYRRDLLRETAENGRKLEAMGQGPQPVDEWVARFRRKDTQLTRQASGGRWPTNGWSR